MSAQVYRFSVGVMWHSGAKKQVGNIIHDMQTCSVRVSSFLTITHEHLSQEGFLTFFLN